MSDTTVPFNKLQTVGRELSHLQEAIRLGPYSGDGPFSLKCCALLERELGVAKALLTPSCTHALELSALLLDVGPGDEVILPSFTFVSVANAFVLRGARPVFAEIRADTLNIDEKHVERLITDRTRAIVAVHYAGVSCEMDRLCEMARDGAIHLIEDSAHGPFGKYKGRSLGSMGDIGTLSFHETKNFTCGEGGALLLRNDSFLERAEILREKGTNRKSFYRGEVDRYTWVDVGSSYLASDLSAAFLLGQLEAWREVQAARKRMWAVYFNTLSDWADSKGAGLPSVPKDCEPAYHLFYVICPTRERRDSLIKDLKSRGVHSVFHYVPLHSSPMGNQFGYRLGDLPLTEDLSGRLLRLPMFYSMSESQQDRVCEALASSTSHW